MEEDQYTKSFYESQKYYSKLSAESILPKIFELISFDSVLDVGCGTGEWLSVAKQKGCTEILGIDGHYVNKDMLAIPRGKFLELDLKIPFSLEKKFDLLISAEVAEHLPESSASTFIASLVKHSNFILFSAAVPGQGGTFHINEQWQDYWVKLFEQNNFLPVDFLRDKIWTAKGIDWWYKQNMILFVEKEVLENSKILKSLYTLNKKSSYNKAHPEMTFIKKHISSPWGRFKESPAYTLKKFLSYYF